MSSKPSADVTQDASRIPATMLVCLPSLPPDALGTNLDRLSQVFGKEDLLVATPDPLPPNQPRPGMELIAMNSERIASGWVLAAADYASAAAVAAERNAQVVLLLGGDLSDLSADTLRSLVDGVRSEQVDLLLPRFALRPGSGLVNSALLYPVTRALFGANIRFPLPADAALSGRMIQRLTAAQRNTRSGQSPALLWPVSEAAVAGYSVREVDAGEAEPPQPQEADFSELFQSITGSLFADLEAKAALWQRARTRATITAEPVLPPSADRSLPSEAGAEVQSMIDTFHLAYANLQEIWSLVLPPQSRLALKKLSLQPTASFHVEPQLWARVVYDFTLAYRLRGLNRGHLLGAMMPLYLAWAASHLLAADNDAARAERHIAETAASFELERPYLVSRWRWPDRFNP
jgi:hypothetical protein